MGIRNLSTASISTGVKRSKIWDGTTTVRPPVSGYKFWLDAADASVFTYSSGSVVSQWTDKSTNGYQFVNSTTASQPSRSTTQNGKGTVYFDGSNDFLYNSGQAKNLFNYLHNGAGATSFTVAKHNSTEPQERVAWGDTRNVELEVGTQFDYYYPSGVVFNNTGAGPTSKYLQCAVPFTDNTWDVRTVKYDQNNATTSQKILGYVNSGSAVTSTKSANWTTASTANATGYMTIGCPNDGAGAFGYYFKGEIAEIIFYDTILNDTDKASVISYLSTKWGI